jgi:hypothetical protein
VGEVEAVWVADAVPVVAGVGVPEAVGGLEGVSEAVTEAETDCVGVKEPVALPEPEVVLVHVIDVVGVAVREAVGDREDVALGVPVGEPEDV